MPAQFNVKTAKDGQFYFHLVSADGRRLLTSEMYKAKASALNGIASIQKNCSEVARYDKLQAKDGRHYLTLKAANYEVIGVSDLFASEEDRDRVMRLVFDEAAGAAIVMEEMAAAAAVGASFTAPAPAPSGPKTKGEATKTLEARKLHKRTMRPISPDPILIPFGAILTQVKEDDRRMQFQYLGEPYDADLARAKAAIRMIG